MHRWICLLCSGFRIVSVPDRRAKAGEEAYIGIKMNSLTDKKIIDKLIRASEAGVKIDMVIRGINCLIPQVPGKTDNIRVVSIVGRFLEHSRIYIFGCGERKKIYIASADFMTRNTVRRVEVAAPIYDQDSVWKKCLSQCSVITRKQEKKTERVIIILYTDRKIGR